LAKVAYLLLCHKDADRVLEQARVLTAKGDYLAIHIDANAGAGFFETIKAGVAGNSSVVFAKRVKCGWGEWSLVKASLNMIDVAADSFKDATHFFLMSGDCMPVKPPRSGDLKAADAADVFRLRDARDLSQRPF